VNGRPRPSRAPLWAGALAGVLAVVVSGCASTSETSSSRARQPGTTTAAGPATTKPHGPFTVVDVPLRSWRRLPPSPPVRIEISSIGVSASLVRLGLNPDGTMQVPTDFQLAGWFTGGPEPGQLGPAVIAGHVDSKTGPAVFYRLAELRPGDLVRVTRADRKVVPFVVESLARYPKQELPGDQVYGPANAPSLRLITCIGTFDQARHSYRENLVVAARVANGDGTASGTLTPGSGGGR
jgi:hypothetical protein